LDIDVDGYKQRRSQSLKALASRLAQKVTSTGQAITLEPMPSNERRIVHLALANHPSVITQSIGDEEARKIVILPKPQEYP
jgi:spoIIIJ-associated protein